MSTEPPVDWEQAAMNYRDLLHEVQARNDELERRLSRRSIDDVNLILLAIAIGMAVVLLLVLL